MTIPNRQRELEKFIAKHFSELATNPHNNGASRHHAASSLEDDQIIELCRKAKNAPKFSSLFDDGDTSAYGGDDSDADFALLGILKFYTQDPDQLERIARRSVLRRPKWDERRGSTTWIRYTINEVLKSVTQTYAGDDGAELLAGDENRHRHRHSNSDSDGDGRQEESQQTPITSVSFAEMEEPGLREEVLGGIFPKGWPGIIFGAAGTIKSMKTLSLGQAIADPDVHRWLGRFVTTCNVMYADWELNVQEQARRAYRIARGEGRSALPRGMRYMTTFGIPRRRRKHFLKDVLDECVNHDVGVCIFDSLGLALRGDPGKFDDVVDMFEEDLAAFAGEGITVIMIGHQRRLQPGERNQSLGVYGSVFHENLARAVAQVELIGRDRENHTVTTRLRPRKANFTELAEPIEVKTTFTEEKITLELVELDDADKAGEETLNAKERVLAALRSVGEDGAGPDELTELCQTLKRTTVRNVLTKLREEQAIENTGEMEGRAHKVRVTVTDTYKDDDDSDGGDEGRRRLTEEEARQVRRLVDEGMSPKWARAEVLGEEVEL